MIRGNRIAAVLIGAALALPVADAAVRLTPTLAANFDNTRTTQYPLGDKPQGGTCPPAGWTQLALGTADGTVCEDSPTQFDITTSGNDDEGDNLIAYQDCSTGDCEVFAQIPASAAWTGHSETWTSFGVGLREGTGNSDWYFQAWVTSDGIPRCKAGTPGPDDYTATSPGGATLPEYLAVGVDDETSEYRCLQSSDGLAWTTYGTYTRAFAGSRLGYVWGTSHDTASTTTATLDGIDLNLSLSVFTPAGGGGAPVLVDPIDNVNGTQGVAITEVFCALAWTGQTDPYTISGLAGGTGLSFNTSTCHLSGTPNANDVGTRQVTINAVNGSGSTPSVFTMTIDPTSGDVFTIVDAADGFAADYDCSDTTSSAVNNDSGADVSWASIRTSGTGATPGSGDTIIMNAGVRGPVQFSNCNGTLANRLRIINQVGAASPVNFKDATGNSSPTRFFDCNNCNFVSLDGSGGHTGNAQGYCGVAEGARTSTIPVVGEDCGFLFDVDAGDPASVAWIGFRSRSTGWQVKGVLVDGTNLSGTGGIGIFCNDGGELFLPDRLWREDIDIQHNVIRDTGPSSGEGMYCGTNAPNLSLPLRRVTIRYNFLQNIAREGINGKYWLDGGTANAIEYNYVETAGFKVPSGNDQNDGINCVSCDALINGNVVRDSGGNGITCKNLQVDSTQDPLVDSSPANGLQPVTDPEHLCVVTNNVVIDPGVSTNDTSECITTFKGAGTNQYGPITVENNTCISPDGTGINKGASVSGVCTASDNIIADAPTKISGCNDTNNPTGTVASFNFDSAAGDDYELSATSTNTCDDDPDGAPALDYEGETRPESTARDIGADESAACP